MSAYYNEIDPGAAAWLRELIKRGLIADGVVDERSILDVEPADVRGFTQCHFFAGIGGWSYALRLAGWPDDRPVWTGSPPCQPFSAAGLGKGRDDERHLAPHWTELVAACRPPGIFGEQVASAAVFGKSATGAKRAAGDAPEWAWFDDLSDRLEAARYAIGAGDIPAAGIGAPHIRQRCFFGAVRLADAERDGRDGAGNIGTRGRDEPANECDACGLADCGIPGLERQPGHGNDRDEPGRIGTDQARSVAPRDGACGMADVERWAAERHRHEMAGKAGSDQSGTEERERIRVDARNVLDSCWPCTPHNPWRDADWLFCRDGKWRPVEPGTFPLAHGLPARVGRLRGYGNAIVPQAAAEFIRAFREVTL